MGTVGLLGVMAAGMGAVLAGRTLARYKDAAMRPLLLFRPFTLVRRTTISDPAATFPVVRFRFAIGGTGLDGFNLGLGDHVKLARGDVWTKPKSYSPLAWGVGGSDDAGDTFDLVVKIYPRNGTSQYLDSMQVGDQVKMSGPFPPPIGMQKVRNGGDVCNIVCYGVGITEALAVAEAELQRDDVRNVTMLWANRGQADEVLAEWVAQLQRVHPTKFTLLRAYSRESGGDFEGRVDGSMMTKAFGLSGSAPATRFLVVGTKEMMKATWETLGALGYPRPAHDLLQKPGWAGVLMGLVGVAAGSNPSVPARL